MKNLCAKTRPQHNPYEIWEDKQAGWKWYVLKKWQANDDKPYARWFCLVYSPICPHGELGDVYVKDIKSQARLISSNVSETQPVEVRPAAYPKRQGKTRVEFADKVNGRTWEKVTTGNSISVRPVPEVETLVGTPQPEAFLRGDSLDRFFQ